VCRDSVADCCRVGARVLVSVCRSVVVCLEVVGVNVAGSHGKLVVARRTLFCKGLVTMVRKRFNSQWQCCCGCGC